MRNSALRWLMLWGCMSSVGCVPGGTGGSADDPDGDAADQQVLPGDRGPTDGALPDGPLPDGPLPDGALADGGCVPDCAGRACGDDGCGSTCGVCSDDRVCDRVGACVAPPMQCGDGACAADEDCQTCPADCGACCGDGVCNGVEDCAACPADCGCPEGRSCTADGLCAPEACVGEGCGGPPRILTFNANVRQITEGGQVVLSAVVTDPDGIADLIGGVLEDPGGASYGAFATAGEEGAYGLTVTWADLHAVRPIEFDGEGARSLIAAFFDQAGNRTTAIIELTLHCRDAGGAACAGACASLDTAEHCGACRAACGDVCRERRCECPDGLTRCDGVCLDTDDDVVNCGRCGETCQGAVGGAPVCIVGNCADPCPGVFESCDGICIDVTLTAEHCGDCGQRCQAPENGTPVCRRSRCDVDCPPDHLLCDGVCAACPAEGAAATRCDGQACEVTRCEDGFRLCGEPARCSRCPQDSVRETVCAADLCVATECERGFHACSEGCCPWRFEQVIEGSAQLAIAADAAGVHIAMGSGRDVSYGRRLDGAWVWEPVAALDRQPQGDPDVTLALADGGVHISYAATFQPPPGGRAASTLRYLRRGADGWQDISGTNGGLTRVSDPSLAAVGGAVALAYDGGTVLAVDPNVGFNQPEEVTALPGWSPHLIAADDGTLHLTWWFLRARTLGYARRDPGGVFEMSDPNSGPTNGLTPRVAIGADGHPAMIHRSDDDRVFVTRFDGERWQTVEPNPGEVTYYGQDLIRGADGRLIGCYSSGAGLFVLREVAGGWRSDEVRNGDVASCRLALAPDGGLHLTFLADGGMQYAY